MEPTWEETLMKTTTRMRNLKKPSEEYKISRDLEDSLEELFRDFEKDLEDNTGEGRISSKHVKLILRAMHMDPSPEDLKTIMQELNPDNTDFISLPELARVIQIKMKDKSSRIELDRAFQLMDKEDKGFLSIDDLRRVAKEVGESISEEELQEMIDEADSSHTGHVSKEDFLKFINKVQENS